MIYYNASITSTQARDNGRVINPPFVKFNETRDAPIVRNASQYYFSIIRFAMNGPNKNLPLFIPIIQTNNPSANPQTDPNKTIYYVSVPYQRRWAYTDSTGAIQERNFTITGPSQPVIYIPETVDTTVAPVPLVPGTGIVKQDLSTRYYWVYTYKHWVDTINKALREAMYRTWFFFALEWASAAANVDTAVSPFPYQTFEDFILDHDAPFIKYDEISKLFEIYGDTRAFNVCGNLTTTAYSNTNPTPGVQPPIPAFVPPALPVAPSVAVAMSPPYLRLFFNSNLYGLFTNFNNIYYNATASTGLAWPLTPAPSSFSTVGYEGPYDYTNEILFLNQNFTNILNNNPLLQNLQSVPPPAYNPFFLIPTDKQNLYWISKQDYNSTNSLWSPVSAIVFTSTLLPVKNEYTSKPLVLGENNVSNTANTPNAFEPIVSDFVVDQQTEKAEGWRDFTLYEPTAEYKMCSMTASHEEIRNIDIQVFWKYRLTGELIPLTMFNCSDVTMKILFRKADYRS